MSAVNAPFGLKPIWHPTGQMRPFSLDGAIASGYASNIYLGDPVRMTPNAGTIAVGSGSNTMLGSFAGCEYTDSFGRPQVQPAWLANTTITANTTVRAYFHTDPTLVYAIQANGSLAQTSIGNQANIVVGTGNATTFISGATISTSLSGSGVQGELRILGLYPDIANAWGDAYTIVMVTIANHQFIVPQTAI